MSRTSQFAFIVGAPRCGTTSIARYLEAHPDICFSFVKEPHFFARYDLRALPTDALRARVEQDYLRRYFAHRPHDGRLRAEGSVSYLYAADQMEPILRLWPDARFVICLRDPLKMLPSLHQRLVFNGDETVGDFAQAWALMAEREQGRRVPRSCFDARSLQYAELARLGTHVDRFFQAVGGERCHVVLFDDFIADPLSTYRSLLAFLDLPDDGRAAFPVHRARQGFRHGWLQRLLKRPPVPLRLVLGGEKFRQHIKPLREEAGTSRPLKAILSARARLLAWNEAPAPRIDVPPQLRREIAQFLAPEIAKLSRVIGRDLGHWLDGTPLAACLDAGRRDASRADPPAESRPLAARVAVGR